ncbi:MAG: membrane protein insertion efficiency factor YidD [Bacteriovoracia bacterium]
MKIIFRMYQLLVSPFFSVGFGIHCRYEESCSRFAQRQIKEKGLAQGLSLGLRRFFRCSQIFKSEEVGNGS